MKPLSSIQELYLWRASRGPLDSLKLRSKILRALVNKGFLDHDKDWRFYTLTDQGRQALREYRGAA